MYVNKVLIFFFQTLCEKTAPCSRDKMRWTSLVLVGLGLATAGGQAPLNKASRQSDVADEDCPADNVSFELITGKDASSKFTFKGGFHP